ncbi:MAG: hypothetical protein LVQ95_02795 [Candidatus Micrarchaeales archaeon]|nr:hypothetical protein [Candidatus Micrarchaeales archaeon]
MPIKYNLTKYDMLSTKVKKVSTKKEGFSKEDSNTMIKAILIASFASGHSWQTYKLLTNGGGMLNQPDVKKEYAEAKTSKWKLITPFDIVEVSKTNLSDSAFSQWLFFNVDKGEHEDYVQAWAELKAQFEEACDDIERTE